MADRTAIGLPSITIYEMRFIPFPTPTELRRKARGCRSIAEATPGHRHGIFLQRQRCCVHARLFGRPGRNPDWGWDL